MDDTSPHLPSYRLLLAVLGGLLALTAATILCSRVDVGAVNIWLTLLIAAAKAGLVLLFFMHLRYERRLFFYTFLATVFTVAVLIGFLFWDVAFRATGAP